MQFKKKTFKLTTTLKLGNENFINSPCFNAISGFRNKALTIVATVNRSSNLLVMFMVIIAHGEQATQKLRFRFMI